MRDVSLFTRVSALFTVIGLLSPLSAHASELSPRAEVSVKGGSERSTLTTEFWAPLAQKSDRVVYTDLRLMGDDDDNREGNLGIGYRQIYAPTNSVLGIHGWIDRRRTEHNSTFHQATFGVESLGDKIDLRANGYVPLNGSHVVATPNLGSATPYLAGNGLFYDTNGSVSETPQYGVDAEAGYRLPLFEKQIDTLRVYGGGYHFFRSNTENVTGFRIRTEAQINQIVSIGARFQHDGPRGSQGFLEATLRFPFSAKKLYQKSGLASRLDESPERDIDIVTASKVDNGLHKEITNTTTGQSQHILYVDNTQTNGDGTKEHPFNNLQSAQQALQANDILYIFRGDGTTHNMDQGITISQPGVQLIGSGSPLTISGYTFLNASASPVLTNTQASVDNHTGNAVTNLADKTIISGITTSNATGYGIYTGFEDGLTHSGVNIQNSRAENNGKQGIVVLTMNNSKVSDIIIQNNATAGNLRGIVVLTSATGDQIDHLNISNNNISNAAQVGLNVSIAAGTLGTVELNNNTISNSGLHGIYVLANNGSMLDTLSVNNNVLTNNNGNGIWLQSNVANSQINTLIATNNTANNNATGIRITASGGKISEALIDNNVTNNNTGVGTYIEAPSNGLITHAAITNSIANNNGSNGIYVAAGTGGTTGIINEIVLSSVIANNNTAAGLQVLANSGTIGNVTLSNSTFNSNIQNGAYIQANAGIIGSLIARDITTSNNTQHGIRFDANGVNSNISKIDLNGVTTTNNAQGIYVFGGTSGSPVFNEIALSNITATSNRSSGIIIAPGGTTMINKVAITNSVLNSNLDGGLQFALSTSAVINQAIVTNITANNNTNSGVYVQAVNSASFNNASFTNITANGNTGNGFYMQSQQSGQVNNVSLSYMKLQNNGQRGLYLEELFSGGGMNGVSVSYSDITGNTGNGVYLVRSVGGGTFGVDLGGGASNSPGQNRIFGNVGNDLNIDSGTISATNNWWNNGGSAPTRVTLSNGGSATYTPLLTSDPRP